MTDYLTNDADLKKVADAIRAKGGTTAPLVFPDGFSAAVGAISTAPVLQEKAVTITANGTSSIVPDEGKDGLSKVDVTVNVPTTPTQEKTVSLSMADGDQVVTPDNGKVLTKVTVQKPATLTPENVKKDVNIGGAVGTLESGAPAKELNYDGVNFVSWDGTVVETWTLEELAAATELPALPAMPSIDSMSRWRYASPVQGYAGVSITNRDEATAELQRIACWNSTLADLKSWAAPAIVGVCYGDHVRQIQTDTDGNEVTIEGVLAQRLAPILLVVDVNEADGMTVTFGDFLGTDSSRRAQIYSWGDGNKWTGVTGAAKTHTYTTPGRYVIQIGTLLNIVLGNVATIQGTLMSAESAPLVKGIIFPFASEAATTTNGNNGVNQFVSFTNNVFEGCSNLKTLAYSPNCRYTGGSSDLPMFTGCYGLETISVPLTTVIHEGEKMNIRRDLLELEVSPQQDYALKFVVFPTGDKYICGGGFAVQGVYQLECLFANAVGILYMNSDAAVTVFGTNFIRYLSLRVIDLRKYTGEVRTLAISPSGAKLWPMAGGKPLQIKVPAALVDQYKADSSWSAYADYIVGV